MSKKILIISHYFYPCTTISALRTNYLAMFLKEKNFDLYIIKKANKEKENFKFKLKKDYIYQSMNIYNININSILEKIPLNIGWIPIYALKMFKIIKYTKIDLIYFTGYPFFYFILGSYFKIKYNIQYILDFRDPWYLDLIDYKSLNLKFIKIIKYLLVKKYVRLFEKVSIKFAKYVINVTESRTLLYKKFYYMYDFRKFITIPNGFDNTVKLNNCFNYEVSRDYFNIGILGKFSYYSVDHTELLAKSLSNLRADIPIKLYIIGDDNVLLEKYLYKYHLMENYESLGFLEYENAICILKNMNCLLLNHRDDRSLGTKIYDYIYCNIPIIAICNIKSEIAMLLDNFQNAFIIDTDDKLCKSIRDIYLNNISKLDYEYDLRKFSRRQANKKLFDYINLIL